MSFSSLVREPVVASYLSCGCALAAYITQQQYFAGGFVGQDFLWLAARMLVVGILLIAAGGIPHLKRDLTTLRWLVGVTLVIGGFTGLVEGSILSHAPSLWAFYQVSAFVLFFMAAVTLLVLSFTLRKA